MDYLLDTCALLWAISTPEKLSSPAHEIIVDGNNTICVSPVSFIEIAIKTSVGKLRIRGDFPLRDLPARIREQGFELIVLEPFESIALADLKQRKGHGDPFDRMLIAQAIARELTLITADKQIPRYADEGLKTLW